MVYTRLVKNAIRKRTNLPVIFHLSDRSLTKLSSKFWLEKNDLVTKTYSPTLHLDASVGYWIENTTANAVELTLVMP